MAPTRRCYSGSAPRQLDELRPARAETSCGCDDAPGRWLLEQARLGYDTPRLARDGLKVMDAMGLEKVVLVGHSIAGDDSRGWVSIRIASAHLSIWTPLMIVRTSRCSRAR